MQVPFPNHILSLFFQFSKDTCFVKAIFAILNIGEGNPELLLIQFKFFSATFF